MGEKFECLRFWPSSSKVPEFDYLGPNGEVIEVKQDGWLGLNDLQKKKHSNYENHLEFPCSATVRLL